VRVGKCALDAGVKLTPEVPLFPIHRGAHFTCHRGRLALEHLVIATRLSSRLAAGRRCLGRVLIAMGGGAVSGAGVDSDQGLVVESDDGPTTALHGQRIMYAVARVWQVGFHHEGHDKYVWDSSGGGFPYGHLSNRASAAISSPVTFHHLNVDQLMLYQRMQFADERGPNGELFRFWRVPDDI